MGDAADDLTDQILRYPTVRCKIHNVVHSDDEWGCPDCEEIGPRIRLTGRKYRPHQKKMQAYVQKTQHPFLFVDMRLGKTLVTTRMVESYRLKNVLVVGPYSCMDAWRNELRTEGIPFTELFGTGESRRESLPALGGWVLTNREIWRTAPGIADLNWDVRILDESTFIKNPFARITQFYNDPMRWPRLVHDWRLSGTPNPESELDFWGQTKRIWKHQNFHEWRGYWFTSFGTDWVIKPRLKNEFYGTLAKHCFFMSREDAGLGVRRIYQTRLVRFNSTMRKIYKKLVREFVLQIPEGKSWETVYAGVKHSWLKRLCGGALPDEQGKIRSYWPDKIRELRYLLNGELAKQPVVVWAHFKEEVERLANQLKAEHIHGDVSFPVRGAILRKFRAGQFNLLVAQPSCLAHSTDLSHCDTMIYYSSPESAEIRKQSEARIEMANKKTPSLIIDLVTEDTIDEIIARNQAKKESRAMLTKQLVQHLQAMSIQ